jgi:Eco57I restriction-modification methylase
MEQAARNKLRGVVTQCRKLLENSVAQELEGKFGIYTRQKGVVQVDDHARMTDLGVEDRAARKDILDHFEHIKARGFKPKDALDQLVREIAYTHLNRFCAYKMMEARQVYVGDHRFREAVSRGVNSNGFKFYLAEHPEDERLYATGKQDIAYRRFLDWLGNLLSEEIGVLFNPNDSANRLYPTQKAIDEVLTLLNDEALAEIWAQDETIGWVYQYFTPKELRDQARKESATPRNSYELAFRNQFFTPRYVVEFLTDNTLGRIWYEMRKGDTKLKDQCRYMVRRPSEVFIAEGRSPPKEITEDRNDLAQVELLKQAVHIPHRPKKDPRELKILDPASGSGHFLLYCFDVLQTIYEEAYDDLDLGPALKKDYPTLAELTKALPGLILSRNLHGIDIDLRATQIAALALWLRCQRAYQEMGLKKERPKITRSNIVCAEPMPGETAMLEEFVSELEPTMLGQLVQTVFEKMTIAGEAGTLLRIEEELRGAIASAKAQWVAETSRATDRKGNELLFSKYEFDRLVGAHHQASLFDLSNITDDQFFDEAEALVVDALRAYAGKSRADGQLQHGLFVQDTVRGFAFVEICRSRFDVILMNPPFGAPAAHVSRTLPRKATGNLYPAFVLRGLELCDGYVGVISDRTFFVQDSFAEFRRSLLFQDWSLRIAVDLGWNVLDTADVQVAAYVVSHGSVERHLFLNLRDGADKDKQLRDSINYQDLAGWSSMSTTVLQQVPNAVFCYGLPPRILQFFVTDTHLAGLAQLPRGLGSNKAERTYRAWYEVPVGSIGEGRRYRTLCNGGDYSPFFREDSGVADWQRPDGKLLVDVGYEDSFRAYDQKGQQHYFSLGLSFPKQSSNFNVAVLAPDAIPTREGKAIVPKNVDDVWFLAGYLNSTLVRRIVEATTGLHKQSGAIGQLPIPVLSQDDKAKISQLSERCSRERGAVLRYDESSRFFVTPWLNLKEPIGLAQDPSREIINRIDKLLAERMNLDLAAIRWLGDADLSADSLFCSSTKDLVSYAVGCALGRWDIRLSDAGGPFGQINPLEVIPTTSPGMLKDPSGEPAISSPTSYPIEVAWDGILVDDRDHPNDIEKHLRQVLGTICKRDEDAVVDEVCGRLGVTGLRDYLRKTGKGGFWEEHVSRYSKSRRKAPIYWLLQSSRKNYALWLYYHRLDKDLLFKALVNYLEPKTQLEINRLDEMRRQKQLGSELSNGVKKIGKDIERQEDLISELRDFEDKLRGVANLHLEPDLNDGVVLNIAPFHDLVPWKEAKNYWDRLLEGEYEWSSISKQLRLKGMIK